MGETEGQGIDLPFDGVGQSLQTVSTGKLIGFSV